MAIRSLANDKSATGPSTGLREEDYRTFCAALESTQRGRDFLVEFARRNRNADTEMLLDSLDRIETMMRAEGAARDRLQDELRVLLIAIRLARPDINSATALTKAARLVDLLDLMENRIDAMVENKDLPPIVEEPLAPQAPFMVVPRPDEPELPIPSVSANLSPIALVQEPARVVIRPLVQELTQELKQKLQQELKQEPKQELPKQDISNPDMPTLEMPQQELRTQELPKQELPKHEALKPALPKQEPLQQELADHEWAQLEILNRPRTKTKSNVEPYELWEPADEAPGTPVAAAPEPVDDVAVAAAPEPIAEAAATAAPEKWLPDFGGEERIIHTKPVTAAAFMPEVTFMTAPPRPVAAETRPESAVVEVAVASVLTAVAGNVTTPAAEPALAARTVPPRVDPLSAIMSLSEAERIALFT
jgi:hypothetical protein